MVAHVLLLAPELWPHHPGLRGLSTSDMANALARRRVQLSIMTTTAGARSLQPLARTLSGLRILKPRSASEVNLFEGRTPSGSATVWALDSQDWPRIGPLALRLARESRGPVHLVHGVDEACAGLPTMHSLPTIATLTRLPAFPEEAWLAAIERASAVVLPSRAFARHPDAAWRPLLGGIKRLEGIVHGRSAMKPPCARETIARSLGLSRHAPLVVTHGSFEARCAGELGRLSGLSMSMVAILPRDHRLCAAFANLASEHPRRFAILSPEDDRAAQVCGQADINVFAADYVPLPAHPLSSVVAGVVVAHASGAFLDSIVSWDPHTRTGNGLLFGDGDLSATLRVALAELGRADSPLVRRAGQLLSSNWARASGRYLDLYRGCIAG